MEFISVTAARLWAGLYKPVKGLFALLFYPLKWLDPLLADTPQADRIPGGYLAVGTR